VSGQSTVIKINRYDRTHRNLHGRSTGFSYVLFFITNDHERVWSVYHVLEMTSLPVTSRVLFSPTPSLTPSLSTIVVSVGCSFHLILFDFLVQRLSYRVVRPLGHVCELIIFPELVRISILDFLSCQFPSRLPLYFPTVKPFLFCLRLSSDTSRKNHRCLLHLILVICWTDQPVIRSGSPVVSIDR
jgi:hypothetical protein